MAPVKPAKNIKSAKGAAKSKLGAKFSSSKPSSSKKVSRPTPKQVKTKPGTHSAGTDKPKKKKERVYTDKELGLPKLNMITPAGVQKPRGKKKGKVFVDDQESMMTILAMVNAEKEGQIESKIMKARQMEEIREAKKKEAEKRYEQKQSKLEAVKDSLRKKKSKPSKNEPKSDNANESSKTKSGKKRVSFA